MHALIRMKNWLSLHDGVIVLLLRCCSTAAQPQPFLPLGLYAVVVDQLTLDCSAISSMLKDASAIEAASAAASGTDTNIKVPALPECVALGDLRHDSRCNMLGCRGQLSRVQPVLKTRKAAPLG